MVYEWPTRVLKLSSNGRCGPKLGDDGHGEWPGQWPLIADSVLTNAEKSSFRAYAEVSRGIDHVWRDFPMPEDNADTP